LASLLLGAVMGSARRGHQRWARVEVLDGFWIGRALQGLLSGPLPVANGLLCEPSLGIIMGQQLGLRLADLGKARLQHLGNALMVLLAGAPPEGMVGGFLG